jgi:steroid delta-isomerase-like uncharacterized protein
MSIDENKATIRGFFDAFNRGDLDACAALCVPDYTYYQPGRPPLDVEGYRAIGAMFLKAFPDGHDTVEEQLGEGDRVATRTTYRGTHRGELMGIPPTGKEVVLTAMVFDRLVNGKIRERRVLVDQFGLLQQIGMIPTPG